MALVVAELVVRTYLAGQFPDARVVTEAPGNLDEVLPCIEVGRFGGEDSIYTLDVANLDVDVYAANRPAALDLAEQVRTSLRLHAEGQEVDGALIAQVATLSAPKWVPYDNTTLRRISASYRIAIRSIP